MLICHEYDYTADADIGIDDVAEDAVGDMFEDVGNKGKGRRKQGKSAKVTGRKAIPFESAANGEIIGSARC